MAASKVSVIVAVPSLIPVTVIVPDSVWPSSHIPVPHSLELTFAIAVLLEDIETSPIVFVAVIVNVLVLPTSIVSEEGEAEISPVARTLTGNSIKIVIKNKFFIILFINLLLLLVP